MYKRTHAAQTHVVPGSAVLGTLFADSTVCPRGERQSWRTPLGLAMLPSAGLPRSIATGELPTTCCLNKTPVPWAPWLYSLVLRTEKEEHMQLCSLRKRHCGIYDHLTLQPERGNYFCFLLFLTPLATEVGVSLLNSDFVHQFLPNPAITNSAAVTGTTGTAS